MPNDPWFTEAQVQAGARNICWAEIGGGRISPPTDAATVLYVDANWHQHVYQARAALSAIPDPRAADYQLRVDTWMQACFGPEITADTMERNHRFLEEAIELVQANGCTAGEAHQLVDYVFGRPVGERAQEVGGAMVTLAALCTASGLDMMSAAETELARVWTKVDVIRAKQAAKPKHSPLPETAPDPRATARAEGFEAAKAKCASQLQQRAILLRLHAEGIGPRATWLRMAEELLAQANVIATLKPEPRP